MTEIRTVFSDVDIDRCVAKRCDPDALAKARTQPDTVFLPIWQNRCLVRGGRAVYLSAEDLFAMETRSGSGGEIETIFLGRQHQRFLFAVAVDNDPAGASAEIPTGQAVAPSPGEYVGLRELAASLPETEAAVLAYARAMVSWQRSHRFCGVCGRPNNATDGGFVMACTDADCGHRSFPRLDPAIIVLVSRGERCLLGRQHQWQEGRFSTIAGFVEPAESLEDAVRREVLEETNIRVGRCQYKASQPWPFPSALMLGFHAQGLSDEIRLNDAELAEARWVSRDDIVNRQVILPPRTSVAYRLIEAWFDFDSAERRLASLDPDG